MNILIKKLENAIQIEKNYTKLVGNKSSFDTKIDKISTQYSNANDFKKKFLEFSNFVNLMKSITSNITFNKEDFINDNADFLTAFDLLFSEEKFDELNDLLNNVGSRLDIYTKNLKNDFRVFFETLRNSFNEIEQLSTISDLQIKFNEIGSELFTYTHKSVKDFLSPKLVSIQKAIDNKSIKILKKKIVDDIDLIKKLKLFFDKTKDISDISKIAKKYKLSAKTTVFLLSIINKEDPSLDSIDDVVLEELENFKQFKNNLIISIKEENR